MSSIEIHEIDCFGGEDGKISISYIAEYNAITMRASVPNDKRRADITVRVPSAEKLRSIAENLEATIEKAKRKQKEQEGFAIEARGAHFVIMGAKFYIHEDVLQKILGLIDAGQNDSVLNIVKSEFPLLTDAGVSEVAFMIHKNMRR